jgi:acyl-CoA thioesterase FadM
MPFSNLQKLPRSKSTTLVLSASKYIFFVLLLINFRSLPFAWHIHVFLPLLRLRLQYYLLRFRILFKPKEVRAKILADWGEGLCPIGANPFELVVVHHGWTSVDDADYNGHLSNSSYAKALDAARLKLVLKALPAFGRSGGWMALGSTHFHFIREIPFLSNYEMRLSIGAWDHKWMFVIARYVSFPNNRHNGATHKLHVDGSGQQLGTNNDSTTASKIPPTTSNDFPRILLSTPAEDLTTPATPGNTTEVDSNLQAEKTAKAMEGLAAAQSKMPESDGAILHCVAISYICFKHGRITVPPGVLLPCEGFSKPPSTASAAPFSSTNPPAHWKKAQALRVAPSGSMSTFTKFLKGGWRDVPEDERWWEDALDGPIEEQRKANLEILDPVRKGMEGARFIKNSF